MPLTPTSKTINDDAGNPHLYTITPHPAEEGVELMPVIVRIIGQAGGPLLEALESKDGGEGGILDREINGEMVGRALTALADEIVRAGGVKLFKDLLKYATRVNDEGKEQKVVPAFGIIYQANYGEMVKAVAWSLEINFAPFLRAKIGSGSISQTIGSLGQRLG